MEREGENKSDIGIQRERQTITKKINKDTERGIRKEVEKEDGVRVQYRDKLVVSNERQKTIRK